MTARLLQRYDETPRAGAALVQVSSLALVAAVLGTLHPGLAVAQTRAPAVMQPSASGAGRPRLDAALARLADHPRDVPTLLEAGDAALAMHDADAATGFFKRAMQIAPRDPHALSGLASSLLVNADPVGAIDLFDQADAAGSRDDAVAADRGLAYDLVGDNARAQGFYRDAIKRSGDPEPIRRLALSQAIAGDPSGAEATLRPLLQSQDRIAWRTRAFIFAIDGRFDEAVTVAKTLLPPELASAITPYLRYMPQLTRAQKAAAANLGLFPRAAEIGHDDLRIAQYTASRGAAHTAAIGGQLVPSGPALGGDAAREPRTLTRAQREAMFAARAAPPDPMPARSEDEPLLGQPLAAASPTAGGGTLRATSSPASRSGSGLMPPNIYGPVDALTKSPSQVSPTLRTGAVGSKGMVARSPSAAASSRQSDLPDHRGTLAEAFFDLGAPAVATSARGGAVDIARLEAVRARAPRLPAPPSHPSRIWVQLATGRDRDALAAEWHRVERDHAALMRGHVASISDWGMRSRLLTGPFESEAAAQRFLQQLAKADIVGPFVWTSPAGQVVDTLGEH